MDQLTRISYVMGTPADWKRLADTHVDAIITDDPAGLLQWLRTQQPPLHPQLRHESRPRADRSPRT